MFRVIKEHQLNFIKSISPQPTPSPEVPVSVEDQINRYLYPGGIIPELMAVSAWFHLEELPDNVVSLFSKKRSRRRRRRKNGSKVAQESL